MSFIAEIFGYVLNFLYSLVNNYGLAIILFSIVLKIVLSPISVKQQKTMKKSAKIQGKMQELQTKYKNNPEKLNQEVMSLYKTEKMSPFSGCLSSIVQLIILLAVFYMVKSPLTFMKKVDTEVVNGYIEQIKQEQPENANNVYPEISVIQYKGTEDERVFINMDFLGIDLSKVPTQSLNDPRVYIIPVLYVVSSFVMMRYTTGLQNKKKKENKEIAVIEGESEEAKKEVNEMDAMAQANKSMSWLMPIMSISIAVVAPLGLALYWLVSNILNIVERFIIDKFFDSKEEKEDV